MVLTTGHSHLFYRSLNEPVSDDRTEEDDTSVQLMRQSLLRLYQAPGDTKTTTPVAVPSTLALYELLLQTEAMVATHEAWIRRTTTTTSDTDVLVSWLVALYQTLTESPEVMPFVTLSRVQAILTTVLR